MKRLKGAQMHEQQQQQIVYVLVRLNYYTSGKNTK